MTAGRIQYHFSSVPWQYAGPGGWVFVSLPEKLSKEIRETFRREEEGWGRLPVSAKVGNTGWKTAIWFDSKVNTYLLALKAEVRKKEKIEIGKKTDLSLFI